MSTSPGKYLQIETLIVVRELFSGAEVSFPVANPSLVSFTTQDNALTEQRMFLEEYLKHQPPHVLASFSCPKDTKLLEINVPLSREDLTSRLQLSLPVTMLALVVPHGRDRWLIVPSINHIFHVSPKDDLEKAVKDEVQRMVTAQEPTPLEFACLFPAQRHRLEPLTLSIDRSDLIVPGKARGLQQKLVKKKRRLQALEVLESVGLPLHQSDEVIKGPRVIGRQRELEQLRGLLGGKQRSSVLLLGSSLVGKTALLFQWLREEHEAGRKRLVFATSGAKLIAGMSGLGQWQERVQRVMTAAEELDALLYIDNLADLFGEQPNSKVDLAGAMRLFLEQERVRLVGELRPEALDLYEHRHVGFISTLFKLKVEPLDVMQAQEALSERIAHASRTSPNRPNLSPQAIQPLIDLVDRYQPYHSYPGKAIHLYEELCAFYEQGAAEAEPAPITTIQLLQTFSLQSGIPLFLLRQDQALKLQEVIEGLSRRLIGQEEAVRRAAETICVVKARLQPPEKPLATFLFVGPTGVGKTELARSLAAFLFGHEKRMIRFDMSEFMDPSAASRLIRGTDRAEGLLTRRVRQQPFCVLLLDEIEKAHYTVFDLLLQVCGEGRLTDAAGRTAFFHNAIIIMTSNLGAAYRRGVIGLGERAISDQDYYQEQVEQTFRPEFVNRLDRVIAFRHLTMAQIKEVARLSAGRITRRRGFSELNVELDLSEGALEQLAGDGFSPEYGARQLHRQLEQQVITPIARMLAEVGSQARGGTISIRHQTEEGSSISKEKRNPPLAEIQCGELVLTLGRGYPRRQRARTRAAPKLGELRRYIHRCLELETVAEVKEQIDLVVAQLSTSGRKRKARDRRRAREQAELQTEHHHLQQHWQKVQQEREALEAVEDMTLTSISEEEDSSFLAEAELCLRRFKRELFYLLVVRQEKRNSATMVVQEMDRGRAFDHWLVPLLLEAEERCWQIEVHIDGEKGEAWPTHRRWGPPRHPAWVLEQLALEQRPFQNLLLRSSGAYVGVVMALESGLHTYSGLGQGTEKARMFCTLITQRFELSSNEWEDERVMPRLPVSFDAIKRLPPIRAYTTPAGPCRLIGGDRLANVPLTSYWKRYEEVGIEHLLAFEEDNDRTLDEVFQPVIPLKREKQP